MVDKLMCIPIDNKQINPFSRLQLVAEFILEQCKIMAV